MEHLNRTCKDAVRGLHANKTPATITRIGKCLGAFDSILEQYDKDNGVKKPSWLHHKPTATKNRDMILRELLQASIFKKQSPRKHSSCPKVTVLLHSIDKTLIDWMVEHMVYTNDSYLEPSPFQVYRLQNK